MTIEKVLIGRNELPLETVDYYMIKKLGYYGEDFYGIEVAETANNQMTSHIEYFSNDVTEANKLVTVLYKNNVSGVHLHEIIDELVH